MFHNERSSYEQHTIARTHITPQEPLRTVSFLIFFQLFNWSFISQPSVHHGG